MGKVGNMLDHISNKTKSNITLNYFRKLFSCHCHQSTKDLGPAAAVFIPDDVLFCPHSMCIVSSPKEQYNEDA